MNIFWGYEDFVDILLGSSPNYASLRVISMQFRVFFLRSRCRIGIFFWVAKITNIFFGVLAIPDIFLGWMVDAGSEPTYAEKNKVPPHPPAGVPVVHTN